MGFPLAFQPHGFDAVDGWQDRRLGYLRRVFADGFARSGWGHVNSLPAGYVCFEEVNVVGMRERSVFAYGHKSPDWPRLAIWASGIRK